MSLQFFLELLPPGLNGFKFMENRTLQFSAIHQVKMRLNKKKKKLPVQKFPFLRKKSDSSFRNFCKFDWEAKKVKETPKYC